MQVVVYFVGTVMRGIHMLHMQTKIFILRNKYFLDEQGKVFIAELGFSEINDARDRADVGRKNHGERM